MKMSQNVKKTFFAVSALAMIAASTGVAFAQGGPGTPIAFSRTIGWSSINEMFGAAVRWGIFFAILVAGLYLVMAGFKYVTAGDEVKQAEAARTQMTNAVVGVIIIASVWLLLKILTMVVPGLDAIISL